MTVAWRIKFRMPFFTSPLVLHDGSVCVTAVDGTVLAFAHDGSKVSMDRIYRVCSGKS